VTPPGWCHVAGALRPARAVYDVDIVILAYDRPAETLAAIASALGQTGVRGHLWVVDQGSQPEAVAQFAAAVTGRPDATLLALDGNAGVPGGRNLASWLGHGSAIAALDNDAEFADPTVLRRALDALAADRALAAIGFRVLARDGRSDDPGGWGYPTSLLPRAAERFATVTFIGAGHIIRRAAWQDAGGYDARLFFTWEEYDFCLRAIARGWRIAYHGDLAVRHKVCPERRIAWSGRRWFFSVRNRLYIERKWGASWASLAPRCLGYLLRAALHGGLWQTLRAILAARRMTAGIAPGRLGPPALAYLAAHDRAHRGAWRQRLRAEIWRPYVLRPGVATLSADPPPVATPADSAADAPAGALRA
jgi:GT2 family glycosyltransferase